MRRRKLVRSIRLQSEDRHQTARIIARGSIKSGLQYGLMYYNTVKVDTYEHKLTTILKTTKDYNEIAQYLDQLIIRNINTYNKYVLYGVINWDPKYMSYNLLDNLTDRYIVIVISKGLVHIYYYIHKFDTSLFLKSYRLYKSYCTTLDIMSTIKLNNEYKQVFGRKYNGILLKKSKMKQRLKKEKLQSLQN